VASIRRPSSVVRQEGEIVANVAYSLADVIMQQDGDLMKAEKLERGSLRIRTRLYGSDHDRVGISCCLLAKVLNLLSLLRNKTLNWLNFRKLRDEALKLYEYFIAISIINEGTYIYIYIYMCVYIYIYIYKCT
jgi:hypothetical protein